jgi:hypothetical protein
MYNDQSANEALSLSIGFKILQSPYCNLFANMRRDDYFYLRRRACCQEPRVLHVRTLTSAGAMALAVQRARPQLERVHAH